MPAPMVPRSQHGDPPRAQRIFFCHDGHYGRFPPGPTKGLPRMTAQDQDALA